MKKTTIIGLLIATLVACRVEPKEIRFGEDGCAWCKMTVMDKRFAAELVTSKGKVYVFDAVECMLHYAEEQHNTEFKYRLVMTYDNPGKFSDILDVCVVKSDSIRSPMGEGLAAFSSCEGAIDKARETGGTLWSIDDSIHLEPRK